MKKTNYSTIHYSLFTVFAQRWDSLGGGVIDVSNPFANVTSILVYNGNLIAGGHFDTAGGQPANSIAEWNGSMWSPLGMGVAGSSWCTFAWTMTIYNGNLIVGGAFGSAGGNPATILKTG